VESGKNWNSNSMVSGILKGEKVEMRSTISSVEARVPRMILNHPKSIHPSTATPKFDNFNFNWPRGYRLLKLLS
jgi:hypothetical protein